MLVPFPVEGISTCHQPLVWLHLISIEKFSPFTVTFCAWITDPIHNQFGLPMFGESSASVENREFLRSTPDFTEEILLIPPGNMTAPQNEAPLRYVQYLVPSMAQKIIVKEHLNNHLLNSQLNGKRSRSSLKYLLSSGNTNNETG